MKAAPLTLILAMIVLSLPTLATTETKEFDLVGISKVEVNNESGNVSITATDKAKSIVTATKKQFGEHCKMTIEKNGTTLLVEVEKAGVFKKSCEVDFQISTQKNTILDLNSGAGDIQVTGTSGDLSFSVGSGKVNIDAEVKELEGKTGSGNVSISGLTTGGSVKTGSGKINLVYLKAPSTGELDIKTGSGSVEIMLPQSSKIRTSFTAGSGEMTNELGDTPNSKFKITMMAGSGSLHIKKSK